ncbi:hypothetical protein PCC7418_3292 [Halothece sp. PCC 7418]|nr:hypothetical protein PCC7418_3292 [Halothece sp. PCC 7418]
MMVGAAAGVTSYFQDDNNTPLEESTDLFNYASSLAYAQSKLSDDTKLTQSWVKPQEFGALGDGNHDDSVAIQAAIDILADQNGGIVYFPVGTYLLSTSHSTDSPIKNTSFITLKKNVSLIGENRYRVTLKRDISAATPNALIWLNEGTGREINGIGIDGVQSNFNNILHGILSQLDIDGLTINNCYITRVGSYGIGLQGVKQLSLGRAKNVTIKNCHIKGTGGDGIDIKNIKQETGYNVLYNLDIQGWGGRSSLKNQAGLDIRGVGNHISKVYFTSPNSYSGHAIRFRGSNYKTNNPGGQESILSNFWIDVSQQNIPGIRINQRGTIINSGYILCSDNSAGLEIDDTTVDHSRISNVIINGSGNSPNASFWCQGSNILLDNCISRNAYCGFKLANDHITLQDCKALNYRNYGFYVKSNATHYEILGSEASSNQGVPIVDKTNGQGIIKNLRGVN